MRKFIGILAATACFNTAFAVTMSSDPTSDPSMQAPMSEMTSQMTSMPPTPRMANPNIPMIKPTTGGTHVTVPSITIVNSKGANIDASGIDWVSNYDIKSSTVNHITLNLVIKNIKITNVPLPIDGSFTMAITVDNVNLATVYKILERFNEMKDDKDNKAKQAEIMREVNDLLPQVVTNTSNVTMREVFTTQQGDIIKDLKFNYPSNAPLPKTTDELFRNMHLTLYVKMAIPLFNTYLNQIAGFMQTAMQQKQGRMPANMPANTNAMQNMVTTMITQFVNDAVQKGYLVKTPTDYVFNLTYEGGVLRINNKTMNELSPKVGSPKVTAPIVSPQTTQP